MNEWRKCVWNIRWEKVHELWLENITDSHLFRIRHFIIIKEKKIVYNLNLTSNKIDRSCYGLKKKQKKTVWSSINKQYECRHQYRMFIHIIDVFNNWANRHRQTAGAVIRWFSLSRRREGVTSSREQSANDCLQLSNHYDHMRKPFWGGRRTASANYLSLCLQNVKDKTGETKHIQEKFFLILITMIYIHIIIPFCLHIL